jgi:hypothetical protein
MFPHKKICQPKCRQSYAYDELHQMSNTLSVLWLCQIDDLPILAIVKLSTKTILMKIWMIAINLKLKHI